MDCCGPAWRNLELKNHPVSLALIDDDATAYYLIEVTPDVKHQIQILYDTYPRLAGKAPKGIIITHAHIGHYGGLLQFSKEAWDTSEIDTYVMPRMHQFISSNAPWSQLI